MSRSPAGITGNSIARLVDTKPLLARAVVVAIAALISLLLLWTFSASFTQLEERLGDLGWTLNPDQTTEQRITVVAIDEASLAQVGPWPWPRETMAELTQAINSAGAQLQIHDIIYSEGQPGDPALNSALAASRGAVLAQFPVLQSDQVIQAGMLTHALTGVSCASAGAGTQIPATGNYLAPNTSFSGIAKGHITPIIDRDGAIRKAPALICVEGQPYPAMAISALLQAVNADLWRAELAAGASLFGPEQRLTLNDYPGLAIPLDAQGNLRISYARHPEAYRAVSAVDVLTGDFPPELLENVWVLVGATAFGIGDIVPTPFNGATPGVELLARMLTSLLDANIPYRPAGSSWLLFLMSVLAAGLLLFVANREERWAQIVLPAAGVALPVAALGLHVQALANANLWLGWIAPALFSLVAAAALVLFELARVRRQRTRVFGNLSSYLPSDLAREIAYSLPSSSINARHVDVTLLYADLRNFSAFGGSRPAEESAALLHFFFTRATQIVEKHHGRVHEFKGDGLLAVWQGDGRESANQALNAAIALQKSLHEDLLPRFAPRGLEPLDLGIGIEQGPALMGSIGPAHRRSHALLGETVTVALRIQELTAELAQPVLVGACAARQLDNRHLQSQGSYLLTGLVSPQTLFALPPGSFPAPEIAQADNKPNLRVLTGGRD